MSLNKSNGNMYTFVTHTHSHLGGECPHKCIYCYVDSTRFGRPAKYQGALRIVPAELKVKYGEGRTIFMENCNDLFAASVPDAMVKQVLAHCCEWPKNTYVFQTKNPGRLQCYLSLMPPNRILGTTVETNRPTPEVCEAPAQMERLAAISAISGPKSITIGPIMGFDLAALAGGISGAKPDFGNIVAASK